MVGLIIYCIGVIVALGMLYTMYSIEGSPQDAGMFVIGMLLSWFTVIFIIYQKLHD